MRVLSAAVFVLLVSICAFAGAGAGAENGVDGGITWNIAGDGTLTISPAETPEEGHVSGEMKDYENPEETPWYASAESLKKLVISNGVTKIGSYAFVGCESLTGDLVIPGSVTAIGDWAFANCTGFSGSLVIGDRVDTIGEFAFINCCGFTGSLVIPDSVTTIGEFAFNGCCGFTGSPSLGKNVAVIGDFAFVDCSGFAGDLVFPGSVRTIGNFAFENCSGITGSVVIPASVTIIGDFAFNNCTGISVIYIAGDPALLTDKYPAEVPLAAVNGGIVKMFPAKPALAAPEKAGYAFAGWYTNPDFSGESAAAYEAGKIYYAKWETELPAPTQTAAADPTAEPAQTQTGASPAPVAGLLAGLGCAAFLFSLRRK